MERRDTFRIKQVVGRSDAEPALARGLGWFGLALGLTEVVMPKTLARIIGADPGGLAPTVIRLLGARQILTGIGVLAQPRDARPLWSRAAGGAVDLALLGAAAHSRSSTARLVGAAAAVAGVTALDVWAARCASRPATSSPVSYAVTINKPPQEVYAFYRTLEHHPLFMSHLESVTEHGDTSHWISRLPTGGTVEWDARITEDRPGKLIAWQTLPGSPIPLRGRITFTRAPARDMTEVRADVQLGSTGERPSEALAKLFATQRVRSDLLRLKQVLETGEVLYSDASLHPFPHPARPALITPTSLTAEEGVIR